MNKKEENPFEDQIIAEEWINSVENEKDFIRDKDIYPRLKSWIEKIKPETILEIGAGQGICSEKLGEFTGKYIGVEPSEPLVDRAKELYGSDKNKEFIIGDAYHLPTRDSSIDAIFSVGVWFHIENIEKASQEIARALKTDGEFYIMTSNPALHSVWESFFSDYEKKGNKITGKVQIPINSLSKNIFYLHSKDDIIKSTKNSGLEITSIEKFGAGEENDDEGLFIGIKGFKK